MEPGRFREFEALAFVYHEPIKWNESDAKGIRSYAPNRSHFIVDRHGIIERVRKIGEINFLQVEDPEIQKSICEADLMDLMFAEGASCALEASGNYHFVTPSLVHTDRFIRVGDLVRNRETLDRLAFWLEQSIGNSNGVLVDSWSISAVALRAIQKIGRKIPFDCIPEHPVQNPSACRAVADALVQEMGNKGKLLVLVSITGSGQLLESVQSILGDIEGSIEVEFLSLYGFESTPERFRCLARIADKGMAHIEGACSFCTQGSIAIPIDPTSYHLRSWREELVMLGSSHCDPGRSFIDTYSAIDGLFFAHRNSPSDNRHHAYDIDVMRLIKLPSFRKKHEEALKQFLDQVDLIISPNHSAGRELLAIAANVLGNPTTLIADDLGRSSLRASAIEDLVTAKAVLIVDDTLNSGSRVQRYIQGIREGGYGSFTSINFHVGLARPETEAEFNRISKSIADHHPWEGNVFFTEFLLLPRWDAEHCPWCKEFELLGRLEESYGSPSAWLTERTQLLRNTTTGISSDPLLLVPPAVAQKLGAASPICNQHTPPMPLTFAIASALQRHRSDSDAKRQLHPDFPLGNVLSPKNFERYSEGLIRAILLRNVTRHELGSQASPTTRDFLLGEMHKDNQLILAGEILAALARSSLPIISQALFKTKFDGLLSPKDLSRIPLILGLPKFED